MKIGARELEQFCIEALTKVGVSQIDARTTAEVLVTTDTWGIFTHGTKNLRGYIRRIRGGGLGARATPKIVKDGPAWVVVDGDSALGMVTSVFAMRTAIEKARRAGFAYVGVRNSCHFGAAGYYASLAIPENMIGIAMCNDRPTVTVPGSRAAVLGSNPLAFGVPAGSERPLLMDMATSTVAGGKVFAAATRGERIPDHWLVDANGLPTADPKLFPDSATLTPMAGHKGYGLALLIEMLSGVLTGAAIARHVISWSFDDASLKTGHGAAFIAVDINSIMPIEQFKARVDQTIREIRESPKAKGADRIYLPGEMEWERREKALAEGIDLPEDVATRLRTLGDELGLKLS
jgi:LDH2 family malate/lactate/ureidoglycolate dehydrogenase